QYLYRRLCAETRRVAYLDGDPGQSRLGPPATMTLAVGVEGDNVFPPRGQSWRSFVGAVSPREHMVPMLIGASRLVQVAQEAKAEVIIYDTCGLVDPAHGGKILKLYKVDLLRPAVIFAIQSEREMELWLPSLRRSRRVRVVDLQPSPAVQARDMHTRRAYRTSQFVQYFAAARALTINWEQMAVFPAPHFVFNRLVALEDAGGFTLGLGFVKGIDQKAKQVTLHTPLETLA
ncbi:MAG: hypothetical protein GY792_35705, partial [Gammaproteobacteria bacterium]|nr:hypothetical protein [Gammaproteobacteria bacterium]